MILQFKMMGEKSKKRCKDSLFVIPCFFTYLNAFFGFLSIISSLEGDYISAAYYIIVAVFMDGFDGRLARALGSSSYFGMELDSLCDAISFCLAPIILLYGWHEEPMSMLGICVLGFYMCAGLARLAHFNTTASQQQTAFIGLPTPIAAFCIAAMVLYAPWIATHPVKILLYKQCMIPILCIALLMISRIKFSAFKRYTITLPHDYFKLAAFLMVGALCIMRGYPIIFFLLSGYVLFGVGLSLVTILRSIIHKNS